MTTPKQPNAARMLASAITGGDAATVVVGAKAYTIMPPTIRRIALAAEHLATFTEAETMLDIVRTNTTEAAAALSCFITGDTSLTDELSNGTLEEVNEALSTAYALCSPEGFIKLSALAGNVARMIAQQAK